MPPRDLEGVLAVGASQSQNIVVLDCRRRRDFERGHIKGAVSAAVSHLLLRRMRHNLLNSRHGSPKTSTPIPLQAAMTLARKADLVIVYDENGSTSLHATNTVAKCSTMGILLGLFRDEGLNARFILGGYEAVQATSPSLCFHSTIHGNENKMDTVTGGIRELSFNLNLSLSLSPVDMGMTIPTRQYLSQSSPPLSARDLLSPGASDIMPFLVVGSERDVKDADALMQRGVTHIVNLTHAPTAQDVKKQLSCLHIPLDDSATQELFPILPCVIDFIDEARAVGGRVIVHCIAGISRSAAVAMAYLVARNDLSVSEAYATLKEARPIVSPNLNFMGQLMSFAAMQTDKQTGRESEQR